LDPRNEAADPRKIKTAPETLPHEKSGGAALPELSPKSRDDPNSRMGYARRNRVSDRSHLFRYAMKNHCETCDGTGTVDDDQSAGTECLICEGAGMAETCISRIKIGANLRNRDELLALQRDARRVISDCGKMLVCNPPHWRSYVSQLEKTIENLEKQVLDLLP
jgi:hypothetical protein